MAPMTATPLAITIPRPPTPHPEISTPDILTRPMSSHMLYSPIIIDPLDIYPYTPADSITPQLSPTGPTIAVTSPSSTSTTPRLSSFRSPRLVLQTSNLFGMGCEDAYTPASARWTPIDAEPADEVNCEGGLWSVPLGELESGREGETCTPISASVAEGLWENDQNWVCGLSIDGGWRYERCGIMEMRRDPMALYTAISPSSPVLEFGQGEYGARNRNGDRSSVGSAHLLSRREKGARSPRVLYAPISPSGSINDRHSRRPGFTRYTRRQPDVGTPISPSASLNRGWNNAVLEMTTPAERFFVLDFGATPTPVDPVMAMDDSGVRIPEPNDSSVLQSFTDIPAGNIICEISESVSKTISQNMNDRERGQRGRSNTLYYTPDPLSSSKPGASNHDPVIAIHSSDNLRSLPSPLQNAPRTVWSYPPGPSLTASAVKPSTSLVECASSIPLPASPCASEIPLPKSPSELEF